MLDPGLKVPASHLTQREPSSKFVGGEIFFPFADIVSDIKGFADGEFYAVKDCAVCGCFLCLTFSTTPGKRFLSGTIIGIAAFFTHEPIYPLDPCKEFEALFVTVEHLFKLFRTKAIAEYLAHNQFS